MQSSNLPPQANAESSRVNAAESANVVTKTQAVARIAQVLQPVQASASVAAQIAMSSAGQGKTSHAPATNNASVFMATNQQLLQVSPAVRLASAENLLLVRLPAEAPIQPPQGSPVPVKTLLPPDAGSVALPTLLTLSPETIRQQVSQAHYQSLMTALSRTLTTPVTLQATVIQQDSATMRVNAGAERPLIIDIPLAKATKQSNTSLTGLSINKPALPATVSLTVSLRQNQLQVQITPPSSSAHTVPASSPAPAASAPISAARTVNVPLNSPLANKLTQAVTQQMPLNVEPPKLASWVTQSLPPAAAKSFQQLSPMLPATVSIKGSEVTIAGNRAQLLAVSTTSTALVTQFAPKVSSQQMAQLNIQSMNARNISQVTITPLNTQPETTAGQSAQQTLSSSAKAAKVDINPLQHSIFRSGVSDNVTAKQTIPADVDSIAKHKLEQLPAEVKTALTQFIRSANRINVSNTDSLQSSLNVITTSLQRFASANPALAKTVNSVIEQLQLNVSAGNKLPLAESSALKPELTGSSEPVPAKTSTDSVQQSTALKQLLTSPAWLQSPLTLSSPPAGQSFLNGLIQLLQVSLLGRHFKSHEDIDQALNRQRTSAPKGNAPNSLLGSITGRQVREFAQLDSQQNLLKQLKGLLAGHQSAKLGNMEQTLQGNDSFYYVLPGLLPQQKPAELLIRRERERQPEQQSDTAQTQWHLTMKLDIGEQGELLTKAKIRDEQLYLDIYSSNQALLEKVGVTLPFLLKRFTLLGLTVEEHKLQLGKIPDTLATRPYQILETQA
ncbi:MAG: hypothetical protein GYB58_03035 [Gammaproteobacteria bacterium]|nr:hypothetical protein [Gammaproteobacteria bacterium]